MIERLKAVFQKKVVFGWVLAPLILLFISFVLFVVSLFFSPDARAVEPPYVYLGLEYDRGSYCRSDAINPLAANLGFGINLYQYKALDINLQYTHHSCAFDQDINQYNAFGIQFKWYPWLSKMR